MDGDAARFPAKRPQKSKKRKKVLRAKGDGKSLAAHPPGADVEKATCHVDEAGGVSAPRLAERAKARPKGGGARRPGGGEREKRAGRDQKQTC